MGPTTFSQGGENGLEDFYFGEASIGGFNNSPWPPLRIGALEALFIRQQPVVIMPVVFPIFGYHMPGGQWIFAQLFEAFFLLFLADVQEEFDDQSQPSSAMVRSKSRMSRKPAAIRFLG